MLFHNSLVIKYKIALLQILLAGIPANQRYYCIINVHIDFSAYINVSCDMRCTCVVNVTPLNFQAETKVL